MASKASIYKRTRQSYHFLWPRVYTNYTHFRGIVRTHDAILATNEYSADLFPQSQGRIVPLQRTVVLTPTGYTSATERTGRDVFIRLRYRLRIHDHSTSAPRTLLIITATILDITASECSMRRKNITHRQWHRKATTSWSTRIRHRR